ncbi:unnamed protein product [Amaranthus hypochondriacus]
MNNIGGSDESGWTIYLDESAYFSRNNDNPNQSYYINDHIDDQDLSMVSDASSGPPHCKHQDNDDQQQCYYNQNKCYSEKSSKKTQKRLKKPNKKDQKKVGFNKHDGDDHDDIQQYHACFSSSNLLLDDTATSPFSHSQIYSNNPTSMGFSQSASSTLFQAENSSYTNQYAFWQSSQVNDAYNSAQPSQWRGGEWQ